MNLRQTVGELVHKMIDRVRERDVHEWSVGEDTRDLLPETRIETVVVADVEEPAPQEVLTQAEHFGITELDRAVTRDVEKWIVPQGLVGEPNASLRLFHLERCALVDGGDQIGKARRVPIPVTSAVILQPRDGEAR